MTYNATRTNGFPSKLEAETYRLLLESKPSKAILSKQVSWEIKPPTNHYNAIYWKIDFRLGFSPNDFLLIESKGAETREFKRTIKYFELFHPEAFERLIFVVYKRKKNHLKNLKVVELSELPDFIHDYTHEKTWRFN